MAVHSEALSRRRHPWSSEMAGAEVVVPAAGDIPAWIDGGVRDRIRVLALAIAALAVLDVSYVMMHLAWH